MFGIDFEEYRWVFGLLFAESDLQRAAQLDPADRPLSCVVAMPLPLTSPVARHL